MKAGLQPVYATIMTSGVVLIVWQGSERVIAGAMTVGAFVAYLELFLRFVNRGHRIPQLVNSLQSGAAAYARLRPLLAPALPVAGEPRFASFRAGHVAGITRRTAPAGRRRLGPASLSLRDVTFQYPGAEAPALRGLNLDIPAGALVAVTGPVGSGKSALARAILGVYPVTSGAVLVDGKPFAELPAGERRGLVGYLPQDASLFSGSLRQNIAFDPAGLGGDDGVHRQAIRLAAIEDDVAGFPHGLDTQIGEAGVRISGGQRQRLGLARALAAAAPQLPALLVLDDPFSAVDVATEAAIVASLRHAFGPEAPPEERVTIVLCSHRLAGFPHADIVLVLERGEVVETGTHADLLAAGGLYARIYRAQRVAESPRDGAGTTMTGLTAPRRSAGDARAPVVRHLVSLLAQQRGSVVAGRAPGAGRRGLRAGPAARHSRHRRSPSDRRAGRTACRRSRCSTCSASRPCRR